VNSAGLVTT